MPHTEPHPRRPFYRSWFERRELGPLLEGMPGRWQAFGEATWLVVVLALPVVGQWVQLGSGWRWGGALLLAAAAVILVRPHQLFREGRPGVAVLFAGGAVVVTLLVVLGPDASAPGQGPRVGIALADAPSELEPTRRMALVTSVIPGSAADGHLRPGDGVRSIAGLALAEDTPAADLISRVNASQIPEGVAVFTVERSGRLVDVPVDLPPPPSSNLFAGAFRETLLRNAALLCVLALFLRRAGQGFRHLGLEREGFLKQTTHGLPALVMLMVGHFLLSVLIGLVGFGVGSDVLEADAGQRIAAMDALLAERLAWTAGIVLLGGVTEEVVFRGFLLPRLRHVTGSWMGAVVITVVLFGAGHLYEGVLATVQTAGIAAMLSGIFLLRRHLMPCIVAHVGFNTLALLLAYLFLELGLFDRLREIVGS